MKTNKQILNATIKAHKSAVEIAGVLLEIDCHAKHIKLLDFDIHQIKKNINADFHELSKLIEATKVLCEVIECKNH